MSSFRSRGELVESLRAMGGQLTVQVGQLTENTERMLMAMEADGLVEIALDADHNTRTYRLCRKAEFGIQNQQVTTNDFNS